jgi:hypothetical protein
MAATENTSGIPPDLEADAQAVIGSVMTGKPLEPDVLRRVREEAEKITERLRREYGELDIGVPAIRGLRNSE